MNESSYEITVNQFIRYRIKYKFDVMIFIFKTFDSNIFSLFFFFLTTIGRITRQWNFSQTNFPLYFSSCTKFLHICNDFDFNNLKNSYRTTRASIKVFHVFEGNVEGNRIGSFPYFTYGTPIFKNWTWRPPETTGYS